MTLPLLCHRHGTVLLGLAVLAIAAQAQPVTQPFTFDLLPHPLPHVEHSAHRWADIDGDGDLDLVLTGVAEAGPVAAVYRYEGKEALPGGAYQAVFTEVGAGLPPVFFGRAGWLDLEGDGDLDLVLTGSRTGDPPYEPITRLYRNEGTALVAVDSPLMPLHSATLAPADYDNDGDTDLLLAGVDAAGTPHTLLYRNEGGTLTPTNAGLQGGAYGDAAWGDFDEDGDLDLVLCGTTPSDGIVTTLYRNDDGAFTPRPAGFEPVAFGSLAWGDYDGDGDLDLALSGGRLSLRFFDGVTRLYENTRGRFSPVETTLPGVVGGTLTWGDYDNDGDLDLFMTGATEAEGPRTARMLRNDGPDGLVTSTFLIGTLFGEATWGDFDGDGDLDLLTSGRSALGPPVTNLYENQRQIIPPRPAAPRALQATVDGATVTLHWTPPPDAAPGLTFNLRVGERPAGGTVMPAPSDPASGRLRLPHPGNVGGQTTWRLRHLPEGTYYWSVQSLDPALQPSPFAPEGTFTIARSTAVGTESGEALPGELALHPGYPNPFRDATTLAVALPRAQVVVLRVYDLLGRHVATLHDGPLDAGTHAFRWDGRGTGGHHAGAGLYLVELRMDRRRLTGHVLLLR